MVKNMDPRLREEEGITKPMVNLFCPSSFPVHDAVEDVAERALGLVALDEGDLDPGSRLDVQHLHAVS